MAVPRRRPSAASRGSRSRQRPARPQLAGQPSAAGKRGMAAPRADAGPGLGMPAALAEPPALTAEVRADLVPVGAAHRSTDVWRDRLAAVATVEGLRVNLTGGCHSILLMQLANADHSGPRQTYRNTRASEVPCTPPGENRSVGGMALTGWVEPAARDRREARDRQGVGGEFLYTSSAIMV